MRRHIVLAVCLATTAPAMAQDLIVDVDNGAPAVVSTGESSTTVDALAGAVSVTLGGEGHLDAHTASGMVEGGGSVSGSINGQELFSIANGIDLLALMLDADGNGQVSDREMRSARDFASASGDCDGVIVSGTSREQIAEIEDAGRVDVALVCADPASLAPAQRAAIAGNKALMSVLAAAGFDLEAVAGIVVAPDGSGTLFLSAS